MTATEEGTKYVYANRGELRYVMEDTEDGKRQKMVQRRFYFPVIVYGPRGERITLEPPKLDASGNAVVDTVQCVSGTHYDDLHSGPVPARGLTKEAIVHPTAGRKDHHTVLHHSDGPLAKFAIPPALLQVILAAAEAKYGEKIAALEAKIAGLIAGALGKKDK